MVAKAPGAAETHKSSLALGTAVERGTGPWPLLIPTNAVPPDSHSASIDRTHQEIYEGTHGLIKIGRA